MRVVILLADFGDAQAVVASVLFGEQLVAVRAAMGAVRAGALRRAVKLFDQDKEGGSGMGADFAGAHGLVTGLKHLAIQSASGRGIFAISAEARLRAEDLLPIMAIGE